MALINLFGSKKALETQPRIERDESLILEATPAQALAPAPLKKPNFLVQGSRLIGNVTVSSDLEISGEVQGNITAKENASICVKGTCKGSIETQQGDVILEGDLSAGNIKSGGDVTILGCFRGETVHAAGKASINGEFSGVLYATDVEVGPQAKIRGEVHYVESFSVEKGAAIGCQLIHLNENEKEEEKDQEVEPVFEKAG